MCPHAWPRTNKKSTLRLAYTRTLLFIGAHSKIWGLVPWFKARRRSATKQHRSYLQICPTNLCTHEKVNGHTAGSMKMRAFLAGVYIPGNESNAKDIVQNSRIDFKRNHDEVPGLFKRYWSSRIIPLIPNFSRLQTLFYCYINWVKITWYF